jgi:hypothetical protein
MTQDKINFIAMLVIGLVMHGVVFNYFGVIGNVLLFIIGVALSAMRGQDGIS